MSGWESPGVKFPCEDFFWVEIARVGAARGKTILVGELTGRELIGRVVRREIYIEPKSTGFKVTSPRLAPSYKQVEK